MKSGLTLALELFLGLELRFRIAKYWSLKRMNIMTGMINVMKG